MPEPQHRSERVGPRLVVALDLDHVALAGLQIDDLQHPPLREIEDAVAGAAGLERRVEIVEGEMLLDPPNRRVAGLLDVFYNSRLTIIDIFLGARGHFLVDDEFED